MAVVTPPPPGQQATAERHAALSPRPTPLFDWVFPIEQSDLAIGEAVVQRGWGAPPLRTLAFVA